jgi:hypothetical protein
VPKRTSVSGGSSIPGGGRTTQRPRSWAARACAAGVAACLGVGVLGTAGAQEEIVRPDIFRSAASALGASIMADRAGLLPIPEVFRFIALDGSASYEGSNQEARASVLFPGNGVIQGPNLACGTFGGQAPPELGPIIEACLEARYPLTVYADSLDPEGSSVGSLVLGGRGDPVSGNAVRAAARAAVEATTTDAAMHELRLVGLEAARPSGLLPVPGLPELDATVLAIDSMTARTDQRIDEASTLVVEAVSTLQGVRLAGGLVEIGSIRSRSVVTDDGAGAQDHDATLEVSGVTVGGVPAQITEDGLVLGSPGGSGPITEQLARGLNEMLGDLGVRITALAAESGVHDDGLAFASSGGVVVEFGFPLQGLPTVPGPMGDVDLDGFYEGTMVLGATGARGIAAAIPPFEVEPVAPIAPDLAGGALPGSPTPGFDAPSAGAPSAPVGSPGTPPGRGGPDTGPTQLASVLDPLVEDLRWLYLAMTLSALGLALSPRFTLPARLPRSVP